MLPFATAVGGHGGGGGGVGRAMGAFDGLEWELECSGMAVDVALSVCALVGDRWVRVGWSGQKLTVGLASRLRAGFSGGGSAWPTLATTGGGDGGSVDSAPLSRRAEDGAWLLER